MQHLDEGTIHAWLDGALPNEERARVEAHAASCAECRALVAEARGMIAGASRIVSMLDAVPAGVIPRGGAAAPPGSLWRTLRVTPARAALAATLLLAVGSMLAVRHDTPRTLKMTVRVMPPAPSRADSAAPNAVVSPAAPQTTVAPSPRASAPAAPPRAVTPESKAAVAVAEPPVDSTPRKEMADERTQVRGVAGGLARGQAVANAAQKAMQLNSVVATSLAVRTQRYPGCYAVTNDSASWPSSIPTRFALDSAAVATAPGQHVVRALGPAGRMDSVLTVATWHEISPGFAMITFSFPEGKRVVTLDMSARGTLTRMSCEPQ